MLEFNFWFFVLTAQFLLLLFILNKILFQPILKIFKEREEAVDGSLEAARVMDERKEKALGKMKAELVSAAQQARDVADGLKSEGQQKQKERLETANAEAARLIGEAREKLRAESDKARVSLKSDVEKFSEQIVSKLIKA